MVSAGDNSFRQWYRLIKCYDEEKQRPLAYKFLSRPLTGETPPRIVEREDVCSFEGSSDATLVGMLRRQPQA